MFFDFFYNLSEAIRNFNLKNVIKFKHADFLLAHYFQSIVKVEEDGIENLSLTVF